MADAPDTPATTDTQPESTQQALRATRPGGNVGVPHSVEIDGEELFYSHVGMRGGPAPVRRFLPDLITRVLAGRIAPDKGLRPDPAPRPGRRATGPWTNAAPSRRCYAPDPEAVASVGAGPSHDQPTDPGGAGDDPMTTWTTDELDIEAADELEMAPLRRDSTPRGLVPIWVVRDGDNLYVRSYRGRGGSWYRAARANGADGLVAVGFEVRTTARPAGRATAPATRRRHTTGTDPGSRLPPPWWSGRAPRRHRRPSNDRRPPRPVWARPATDQRRCRWTSRRRSATLPPHPRLVSS